MNARGILGFVLTLATAAAMFLSVPATTIAGTTGGIGGTVADASGAPVADASVAVTSPSESTVAKTDAAGHFNFLTLPPDTYALTITKDGYDTNRVDGVTVVADGVTRVPLPPFRKSSKVLGVVTVRSSTELVKPGVSTIEYSVNATTAEVAGSVAGNGYDAHNIYGLAQLVPGVVSSGGLHIRGSQPSQVSYEYDGVPVNRAFDAANASTGSTAGLQELQVYTGGGPASSAAESTAGFINEVIKTGTYPGFTSLHTEFGAPAFDHVMQLETGGGVPDRRFTWYFGLFGQNNTQRTYSQFDGAGIDLTHIYNMNGNSLNNPGPLGAGVGQCSADGSDPYLPFQSGGGSQAYPPGGDPGCVFFPFPSLINSIALNNDRDSVANFHYALPHKRDSGKDDVQLLYSNGYQFFQNYSSINDAGGFSNVEFFNNRYNIIPAYRDSVVFAPGTQFGQTVTLANAPAAVPYLFPSSPSNRCANLDDAQGEGGGAFPLGGATGTSPYVAVHAAIPGSCALGVFSTFPTDLRDGEHHDFNIVKAQYTKNINENSYLRAYGYTFYSDWLTGGAVSHAIHGTCCEISAQSADYEVITHTRGTALQYANQFSSEHLFTATANFATANSRRWQNLTYNNSVFSSATSLVSFDASGNPTCYNYQTGDATICDDGSSAGSASNVFGTNITGSVSAGTFIDPTRSNPNFCGAGAFGYACWAADGSAYTDGGPSAPAALAGAQWIVTHLGPNGPYNTVKPLFSTLALQDQYRPSDKLAVNAGLRIAIQKYEFPNSQTPAENFWFAATRQEVCYNLDSGQPYYIPPAPNHAGNGGLLETFDCTKATGSARNVHPDGLNGHFLLTDVSPSSYTNHTLEPNVGMTYTLNQDTVLRLHGGVGSDPVETAFTQYLNPDAANDARAQFQNWFGLGYFSPVNQFRPQTATNIDASFERHFKGTDLSMTVTPFFRHTNNQYIGLSVYGGLASAYPGARMTSTGLEVQLRKGDYNKNGLSALLNWTYNKEIVKFFDQANGKNNIDVTNYYIDAFNSLTAQGDRSGNKGSTCYNGDDIQPDPTQPGFNPYGIVPAGDCSVVNGQVVETPEALAEGDIVNPYYVMNPQANLDKYAAYSADVAGIGVWPNVFSGFLNYRHNKLAITPIFTILEGTTYGNPQDISGIDPRTCGQNQSGGFQNGYGPNDPLGNPISPIPNAPNPGLPMWLSCKSTPFINNSSYVPIPDPQTGLFHSLSEFRQPWQLFLGATFSYDLTSRMTARLSTSSLYHTCWGGSKTPWSTAYPPGDIVCSYGGNPYYVSNFFNGAGPGDVAANGALQIPLAPYQFAPRVGSSPFFATFQVDVKL